MADIMEYNPESFDDKAENYILERLFDDKEVIDKMYSVYDKLGDQPIIESLKKKRILWRLKQAFLKNCETNLSDEKKLEITMLFFGRFIYNKEDLELIVNDYKNDIEFFRKKHVNAKWIIFFFIETIIEKMVDIDDSNFDFFKYTNSAKDELFELMKNAIIEGLELLMNDTNIVLNEFNTFFDKLNWCEEDGYMDVKKMVIWMIEN